MTRQEEEQFEQDRLGNSRRKLDTLRAQEGNVGGGDDGLLEFTTSAQTGTQRVLYSLPTHASQVIVTKLQAHNSQGTAGSFYISEADLDGNGSITSTTRRSVNINVGSLETSTTEYEGKPFEKAIAVQSEFQGQIGVAVISDHHEEDEPASEVTGT